MRLVLDARLHPVTLDAQRKPYLQVACAGSAVRGHVPKAPDVALLAPGVFPCSCVCDALQELATDGPDPDPRSRPRPCAGEIRVTGTSTCALKSSLNTVVLGPCTGASYTKWHFASDGVNFGPIKHQVSQYADYTLRLWADLTRLCGRRYARHVLCTRHLGGRVPGEPRTCPG